jgi:hypothetical protein
MGFGKPDVSQPYGKDFCKETLSASPGVFSSGVVDNRKSMEMLLLYRELY